MSRSLLVVALLLGLAACCPATQVAAPLSLPTAFVASVRGVVTSPPGLELETGNRERVRAGVTGATKIIDVEGDRLALADLATGNPRVYVVGVLAGADLRADEIHVLTGP